MILISGGGIVGSHLATRIARHDDVRVVEEHDNFHKTCSALITTPNDIPRQFITNRIRTARIMAPDGKCIEVTFKRPDVVFARDEYVAYLAGKAQDAGVQYCQPAKIRSVTKKVCVEDLRTKQRQMFMPDLLVGADGALSTVGKETGLLQQRTHFVATKTIVKYKHNNSITFYPFVRDFAWVIPHDEDTAEIGIAARQDVSRTFTAFCQRLNITPAKREAAIIPWYSAKQPIYKQQGNMHVALVGDAAGQVKATTGGGIIYGMKAAIILADCIRKDKLHAYPRLIKKNIGRELSLHLQARRLMDKMTIPDWNRAIALFQDSRLQNVLGNSSRDRLSRLAFKSIVTKPQLLQFAKLLF
ncbi:MAG: NAD(P)/FAD-dependent oxidoreductase [archaeon]